MSSPRLRPLSEIAFITYRNVLTTLTVIVVLRILFSYPWAQCALYGVSSVSAFFVGQGIVSLLRYNSKRQSAAQENDLN